MKISRATDPSPGEGEGRTVATGHELMKTTQARHCPMHYTSLPFPIRSSESNGKIQLSDVASPEELDVSSFFSSSSLSLFSPPVSVPASLSLSVSLDSSTLMVGVLGLLLLLGSRPRLRPPGRFGGVFIRSAVRAAANSFAPSYKMKRPGIRVKFYNGFGGKAKK